MKRFFILLIAFVAFVSCNKKSDNAFCADGFIYWGGDYAVDGTGWYFSEGRTGYWQGKQLKETELPDQFKNYSDSTAVRICLEKTSERAPCFCATPSYFYKITSIKKR